MLSRVPRRMRRRARPAASRGAPSPPRLRLRFPRMLGAFARPRGPGPCGRGLTSQPGPGEPAHGWPGPRDNKGLAVWLFCCCCHFSHISVKHVILCDARECRALGASRALFYLVCMTLLSRRPCFLLLTEGEMDAQRGRVACTSPKALVLGKTQSRNTAKCRFALHAFLLLAASPASGQGFPAGHPLPVSLGLRELRMREHFGGRASEHPAELPGPARGLTNANPTLVDGDRPCWLIHT